MFDNNPNNINWIDRQSNGQQLIQVAYQDGTYIDSAVYYFIYNSRDPSNNQNSYRRKQSMIIPMGESNTILSAYTLYRHLG